MLWGAVAGSRHVCGSLPLVACNQPARSMWIDNEPAADLELHWVSVHRDKDHFEGFAVLFEFAVCVGKLGCKATAGRAPAAEHTVLQGLGMWMDTIFKATVTGGYVRQLNSVLVKLQ